VRPVDAESLLLIVCEKAVFRTGCSGLYERRGLAKRVLALPKKL